MVLEINNIYNMDCLEGMKQLEDNSVDLIVTDPPYEIDGIGGGGTFGTKNRKYHRDMEEANVKKGFNNKLLVELLRVLKKVNIYIFCNKNQIYQISKFFKDFNVDLLVYHKKNPIPTVNNKYLSDLEYIFFIREKGVKIYGDYKSKSKLFSANINKNNFDHPTVKPIALIRKLILNSSIEGNLILDCFLGSGTTAVACKQLRRNFIGFEIDKDYYDIAQKRLDKTNIIEVDKWF